MKVTVRFRNQANEFGETETYHGLDGVDFIGPGETRPPAAGTLFLNPERVEFVWVEEDDVDAQAGP